MFRPTRDNSASAADAAGLLLCACPACVAARNHGQDNGGPQAGDLAPAAATTTAATATAQGAPAYYVDALINEYDYKWGSGAIGTPVTVTYSFLTSVPSYYASNAAERVNFAPMNATQMAVVRDMPAGLFARRQHQFRRSVRRRLDHVRHRQSRTGHRRLGLLPLSRL